MIEWKEKANRPKVINFERLNVGDTFMLNCSECTYMRINSPTHNAVNLKTGFLYKFNYNDAVYFVDLVIEYSLRT